MKIDIHTHTRKCKQGDAETREITAEKFCAEICKTDVGIVAITNHNLFDYEQYKEIIEMMDGQVQVWPGIELDVIGEDDSKGHVIVIVSPNIANRLNELCKEVTNDTNPDKFRISIKELIKKFDPLNPVYIAHYKQKRPCLSEAEINNLTSLTKERSNVIKEVTNSISAGIYISHGKPSLYGSDISNWDEYETISQSLPELRIKVDSFEQVCLLLKKDQSTIKTILEKKNSQPITITPFQDDTRITLPVFKDINIIFGAKGTGKSDMLKAIARHYKETGVDQCSVYESSNEKLEIIYDFKGSTLEVDLSKHGIDYCQK